METAYNQALKVFNHIFQQHQLDEYKVPKHANRAYNILLKIGYIHRNGKYDSIVPGYKEIGLMCQRYRNDINHEHQFNSELKNHYSLKHISLHNTTIKVFFFILVVCYCLYFGISRPDILFNTLFDNIFFGGIFPIVISGAVAIMYSKEMYADQHHNNREAEYQMYLQGQVQAIKKLYLLRKGK